MRPCGKIFCGNHREEMSTLFRQVAANGGKVTLEQISLALLSLGRTEEAAATFKKALDEDPDCHFAHLGLGRLLSDTERFKDPLLHLFKAGELRPRDYRTQRALGNFFLKRGLAKTALVHFRAALRIRYDDVESAWGKGKCLQRMGKSGEAIRTYKKALRINNDFGPVHRELAEIYAARPGGEKQRAYHMKALEVLSMAPDASLTLGSILEKGKPAAVREIPSRSTRKAKGKRSLPLVKEGGGRNLEIIRPG